MKLTLKFDVDLYDNEMAYPEFYENLNREIEARVARWFERDACYGDVSNFEVISWADK